MKLGKYLPAIYKVFTYSFYSKDWSSTALNAGDKAVMKLTLMEDGEQLKTSKQTEQLLMAEGQCT
jgi:hypothetical protein